MTYVKTNWSEMSMNEAECITALNNAETQYDEIGNYATIIIHNDLYYSETYCDDNFFCADNDGSGSGFIALKIDGYTYEDIINGSIPEGIIGIWYGNENAIPSGFVLCNGSNSTPDLRARYPIAAGNGYTQGTSYGNNVTTPTANVTIGEHALTVAEIPSHYHKFTDYYGGPNHYVGNGDCASIFKTTWSSVEVSTDEETSVAHGHTGSTIEINQITIMPKSVAYCYIMKSLTA